MAFTADISAMVEVNGNGLLGVCDGWPRRKVSDFARVQNGAPFASTAFNNNGEGVPLIRIRDILRSETETFYSGPYDDAFVVTKGDLLVGMDGDFNHAIWDGPPALLNQRVCRLVFEDDDVNPRFVAYMLGAYLRAVNDLTHSITVKHLSSKTVAALPLPCPARTVQDAVVERLDALGAVGDAGNRHLSQARTLVRSLREAVLHEAYSRDATVTIDDVGDVFVGATPKRDDLSLWDGTVPWVSSGEVTFGHIAKTREGISESALGNVARRLHPPGTVLVAMIGEGKTRGQAAILDVPAAHNQNCASIRVDQTKMLPEYLFYWFMARYNENRGAGAGSQQPALNGKLVRALQLPCPAIDEQKATVARIQGLFGVTDGLERDLVALSRTAQSLSSATLRAAINGALPA